MRRPRARRPARRWRCTRPRGTSSAPSVLRASAAIDFDQATSDDRLPPIEGDVMPDDPTRPPPAPATDHAPKEPKWPLWGFFRKHQPTKAIIIWAERRRADRRR